ncbi:hypothetical protein THRCLA_21481, partial [Thraustotheca clavata]
MDDKLKLLQHPIMKRVIDIKWELFGAKEYFKQLLLYILMLMAMTNAISSIHRVEALNSANSTFTDIEKATTFMLKYGVWIFTICFCAIGIFYLRDLEHDKFLKKTQEIYKDTKCKTEADKTNFVMPQPIPEISVFKAEVRSKLFYHTLFFSIVASVIVFCVLVFGVLPHHPKLIVYMHAIITWAILFLCTIYFIAQETKELIGEDPWIRGVWEQKKSERKFFAMIITLLYMALVFPVNAIVKPEYRKYFASFTNLLQIATYYTILFPFTALHILQLFGHNYYQQVYFYCGAGCTISLWMLSLQFLEVHWTSGYLLPIIKDVLRDVKDFFIFYFVFQCGLTCAYYFLFQKGNEDYTTIWSSFYSTFFVMFGENNVSGLIASSSDVNSADILSVPMTNLALILRMFHAGVMVVLLLNLLLAMVNKTVDRNWEKLQSRTLASYARAMLRLEKMVGGTNANTEEGEMFTPMYGDRDDKSTESPFYVIWAALRFKDLKHNPIFQELVAKEELLPNYLQDEDTSNPHCELQEEIKNLEKINDDLEEDDDGMSAWENAYHNGHLDCASIIRKEAYYRASNKDHPFREHIRAKIAEIIKKKQETKGFDANLFRQIIKNEPDKAKEYLNLFYEEENVYFHKFIDMQKIFGVESVVKSPLAAILKESIIPSQRDKRLECLNHPVMKRVLDIKWELFAARKYYQQLLLYSVMLMAMSNVVLSEEMHLNVSNFYNGANKTSDAWIKDFKKHVWLPNSFVVWIFTIFVCISGTFHLTRLDPIRFVKLTRAMHYIYKVKPGQNWLSHIVHKYWLIISSIYAPGRFTKKHNTKTTFPQVEVYKQCALHWLTVQIFVLPCCLIIPLYIFLQFYLPTHNFDLVLLIVYYNKIFTSLLLALCAVYFLVQEGFEAIGENPEIYQDLKNFQTVKSFSTIIYCIYFFLTPWMPAHRKYFTSFTNMFQIFTYLIIIIPFSITTWFNFKFDEDKNIFFMTGAVCTINLWMILLEFLEVNKTAGYLLPTIREVLGDIWDCLVFYAVFQCGLTCAFYFIFQQHSDAYGSVWKSFCSTYFVLFGENGVDSFSNDGDDSDDDPGLRMHFGLCLRMFHCVVMVVLLMNLLVAIMNKTVDRNWEMMQSRALTSYARAILRIEKILSFDEEVLKTMTSGKELNGCTHNGVPSRHGEEKPLLDKTQECQCKHPIFSELVSKLELEEEGFKSVNEPDDHVVALNVVKHLIKEKIPAMKGVLTALNESVGEKWEKSNWLPLANYVIKDVWDFFIFYGVFQCGLTITKAMTDFVWVLRMFHCAGIGYFSDQPAYCNDEQGCRS